MNNLKNFDQFISEEADYRNVNGYGSSGSNDPQNAGPSFNKGADAATYSLPSVVGVVSDDIEDPYFGAGRQQKRKRIKKNPTIEKNRKQKTKYLDKIDTDTRKNLTNENNIKWYSKGKFTKDENQEEIVKNVFEVGDIVICKKKPIYWNVMINHPSTNNGEWKINNYEVPESKIVEIDYCENKEYIGQIIKLGGSYWPWFQITNFEKI